MQGHPYGSNKIVNDLHKECKSEDAEASKEMQKELKNGKAIYINHDNNRRRK